MLFSSTTRSLALTRIIFVLLTGAFSLPVNAANASFSFIEFNIAFVLGLCLPVLLIVAVVKPQPIIKKRYPTLLTLTLLLLLYTLTYLTRGHAYVILSICAAFLSIGYFWSAHHSQPKTSSKLNILYLFTLLLLAGFLVLLWTGAVSPPLAWLIFGSTLLIASLLITLLFTTDGSKEKYRRTLILWCVNVVFTAVIYFWLIEELSENIVVIAGVLTYVATMIEGCWHVIKALIHSHHSDRDIEKRRTQVTKAVFDPVTNLPIYHYALNIFEHNLQRNSATRYAAVVFKPTNFQQVNGVLGHKNSDILLLQLAYCLQKGIENDDALINFSSAESPIRVARLQGLHFLVVLDVSRSKHPEETLIEQLCSTLTEAVPGPMSFKCFSSYFKLAFGVAYSSEENQSASEIIACAEDALLAGRAESHVVSYFNQEQALFNQQKLQRMEMLKKSIQTDSLQWFAQPQINVTSKEIVGFEITALWQTLNKKSFSLAEFISLAEQSGDIHALTRQMVAFAFKVIAKLKALNLSSQVTIKLSSTSLLEHDLVEFIERQATQNKVSCELLLIEIEESILFIDSLQAKTIIDQFKSLGIKIAIGGFSGSYEALRYIRRLAVSQVKINCQTLAQAEAGSSDKAIINALINLTRKMELPLIGTDVNSMSIEERYKGLGGEFAQGKLYNSGVALADIDNWLAAWHKQYPVNK